MGVLLDGSSDYYVRNADLDGNADSKTGIASFWSRFDGGDGTILMVLNTDGADIQIQRETNNRILFFLRDALNVVALQMVSTAGGLAASALWRHVLASWDVAAGVAHLYVDDSEDKTVVILVDLVIDYTQTAWGIGASAGGAALFDGALAEFYFAPNQFLDFSVEANRRKFITAEGTPANLGADGSLPTGTAPLIYCAGGKDAFPANYGTGGSFAIGGGAPLTVPFPAPEDTRARTRHRLGADYYR